MDPKGIPFDIATEWTVADKSAAATAKTITKAAEAGKRHYITYISATVLTADVTGDPSIELQDGSTVKFETNFGDSDVRGATRTVHFTRPIRLSVNTAANLVSESGGTGAVIALNMGGFTR